MSSAPPSYTLHTPSYAVQSGGGGEQSVGFPSRFRSTADPTGLHDWTKKVGYAALTLTNQAANNIELPVYGRNASIAGFVALDNTQDVTVVRLKLGGHVKCKTIAEFGESNVIVLNIVETLWTKADTPCPNTLPFEFHLPATFTWENKETPMPPSFDYSFYDVQGGTSGLKAKVKYEISVEIEHTHVSLKDRLTAALSTPFIYLPRSRPGVPPSSTPTFVFSSSMEFRVGGKRRERDPIIWKLCLPPPGTYAICQPIPFRVTVTSRSSSLLMPFSPSKKNERASIRVYMLRKVSIKVNTIDLWQSYVIAEGALTFLPQAIGSDTPWLKNVATGKSLKSDSSTSVGTLPQSEEGWATLDWSGVLTVGWDNVVGGGFEAAGMIVKDFIVLSVLPPNPDLGDLLEVKRVVPIQLTTDTWGALGRGTHTAVVEVHGEVNQDNGGHFDGKTNDHHEQGVNGASMSRN